MFQEDDKFPHDGGHGDEEPFAVGAKAQIIFPEDAVIAAICERRQRRVKCFLKFMMDSFGYPKTGILKPLTNPWPEVKRKIMHGFQSGKIILFHNFLDSIRRILFCGLMNCQRATGLESCWRQIFGLVYDDGRQMKAIVNKGVYCHVSSLDRPRKERAVRCGISSVWFYWLALMLVSSGALQVVADPLIDKNMLIVTNFSNVTQLSSTNPESRMLVQVDLQGTVLISGNSACVAAFDGSPAFQVIPTARASLQRGQRIEVRGQCLLQGTSLYFTKRPLIENDGLHIMNERSASLWLEAGKTPMKVSYFNRTGERGLELYLQGPDLARQSIPTDFLVHAETNSVDGSVAWKQGLWFRLYQGDWTMVPDFEFMNSISQGVATNFDCTLGGQHDYYGLVFEGCLNLAKAGIYTISCASDDGSLVDLGDASVTVIPTGSTNLPALPRLVAGQSIGGTDGAFCSALEGVVTFAAHDDAGGLTLEISSGRGKAEVRLPASYKMGPLDLMGARVRATGICQAVYSDEGYKVAGRLTVDSDEGLEILDFSRDAWNSRKIMTVQQATLDTDTNPQQHLIRLRGVVEENSNSFVFRDKTGSMELLNGGTINLEPGSPAEAVGLCERLGKRSVLKYFALRTIFLAAGKTDGLPLLTTVREVKQLSRTEAKRGYPVKVRGVITFVWPNAGFFLQDATWSIDVRLATNAPNVEPHIGEYWEVKGQTFAEFAPDILAINVTRLGLGTMPEPGHPSSVQLVDGSMDTQYIELEGVALGADGTALSLLTRGGRLSVHLPELSHDLLARIEGARIRVRGCVIPGRDVNTEQVKLGEFELRNASVAVDEPAPADPFAMPLEHVTDLLLFESHASPIQRACINGIVLAKHRNQLFLLDQSNGVRVVTDAVHGLQLGDRIEAVGFPDLTGPAPVFNNAIVRRLDHVALPEPTRLNPDHLLSGAYDSTRVAIKSTLEAQRVAGGDQLLELRAGPRLWMARLPVEAGLLPEMSLGSELLLTGVYAGQGGDRMSGRDIDSFELLMNSPSGVRVLSRPSWWTARHALIVAGVLLAVLGLAAVWIWGLRRRVEERTRALKSEIEDHKSTELELEKKTLLLTQEIEERRRIEAEVERGHKQLLVTSRLAGMAEVATSVLHNVGNVMTSVNVLSTSIVELVRDSKIASVTRLADLLRKNSHELDRFVRDDERGRNIPDYVGQLGEHLTNEQALLLQKVRVLNENIHHINEIVAMQQNYAKVSGVLETLPPQEIVEDSLRMHGESIKRHGIKLVRDYARLPTVTIDRHKILQILFNLFENAIYACLQSPIVDKKIVVRLEQTKAGFMRLAVEDNGMGIAPENLSRIFAQGFSTRRDGHGFGLHSSILAAQDMGGTLTARSDGPGLGATFVLEIPMKPAGTAPTEH